MKKVREYLEIEKIPETWDSTLSWDEKYRHLKYWVGEVVRKTSWVTKGSYLCEARAKELGLCNAEDDYTLFKRQLMHIPMEDQRGLVKKGRDFEFFVDEKAIKVMLIALFFYYDGANNQDFDGELEWKELRAQGQRPWELLFLSLDCDVSPRICFILFAINAKIFCATFTTWITRQKQTKMYRLAYELCCTRATIVLNEGPGESDPNVNQYVEKLKAYAEVLSTCTMDVPNLEEEILGKLRIGASKKSLSVSWTRIEHETALMGKNNPKFYALQIDPRSKSEESPGYYNGRVVDTNFLYQVCGDFTFVFCNSLNLPKHLLTGIIDNAIVGNLEELDGFLGYFVDSMAIIGYSVDYCRFGTKKADKSVIEVRKKYEGALGYMVFKNAMYKDKFSVSLLLKHVTKMFQTITESDGLLLDFFMKNNLKDVVSKCEKEYFEICSGGEPDIKRVRGLMYLMLTVIGGIPSRCGVNGANVHILRWLRDQVLEERIPVARLERQRMIKDARDVCFFDSFFSEIINEYDGKYETLKTRFIFTTVLRYSIVCETNKGVLRHLLADYWTLDGLRKELCKLAELFCLCSQLSFVRNKKTGEPVIFSKKNVDILQNWEVDNFCRIQYFLEDVPSFFNFVFDASSNQKIRVCFEEHIFNFVSKSLFLGYYETEENLDAYIKLQARSGPYSAIFCSGFMLIPRLKELIHGYAKIAMWSRDTYGDFYDCELKSRLDASSKSLVVDELKRRDSPIRLNL
jgi:hypothetical protein